MLHYLVHFRRKTYFRRTPANRKLLVTSMGPSRGHSFCEADRVYGVMRHALDGKQLVSMPETMKQIERNVTSSIGAYSFTKERKRCGKNKNMKHLVLLCTPST